jgi:hypothetical protein
VSAKSSTVLGGFIKPSIHWQYWRKRMKNILGPEVKGHLSWKSKHLSNSWKSTPLGYIRALITVMSYMRMLCHECMVILIIYNLFSFSKVMWSVAWFSCRRLDIVDIFYNLANFSCVTVSVKLRLAKRPVVVLKGNRKWQHVLELRVSNNGIVVT